MLLSMGMLWVVLTHAKAVIYRVSGFVWSRDVIAPGLSLLCSKIYLLFFWEFPPKATYYSHNFILLFSNYSHNTKSHVHQNNHVPCTKSTLTVFARENIRSVA